MAIPIFVFAVGLAAKCGAEDERSAGDPGSQATSREAVATGVGSSSATTDPKKFCAALLPELQKFIKAPLTIASATDASTDNAHTGEAGFLSCVNTSGAYRVTIIMSDEKSFTKEPKAGYQPLAGFGDFARSVSSAFNWVDVMKGHRFCEAIVGVSDSELVNGDWKQTGGKMCEASYSLR